MSKAIKPASDTTCELAVLGAVLNGQTSDLARIATLHLPSPLAFFATDHRIVWMAVLALLASDTVPDATAVATRLGEWDQGAVVRAISDLEAGKPGPATIPAAVDYDASALARIGGYAKVAEIAGAFAPASALERNAEVLADLWAKRKALDTLERGKTALRGDRWCGDVCQEVIGQLQGLCAGGRNGNVLLTDALKNAVHRGDANRILTERGIATHATWGLQALDRAVRLGRGGVTVLTAPTGGGKTVLGMQAALATWKQAKTGAVLYITLEVTADQLAARAAACECGVAADVILDGYMDGDQRGRVEEMQAEWAARGNFLLRDSSAGRITAEAIAAECKRVHDQTGLALVVIDHLHLLPSPPRTDRVEALSQMTGLFKRMAVSLGCPVLLLCQLNRVGSAAKRNAQGRVQGNPEPVLGDLKGSGTIETDADAVVMLWQREPTDQTDVVACVRKNRHGPLSTPAITFEPERSRFTAQPAERAPGHAQRMASQPSDDECPI